MGKWTRAMYWPGLPLGDDGRRVTASREHIDISRRIARGGMVLLKNDGTLPLGRGNRVALFGKGTFDYVKGGGGSGDVITPYVKNIYDGFAGLCGEENIFADSADLYREYVMTSYENGALPGLMPEPDIDDSMIEKGAAFADTAVISISRFSGEAWDRHMDFDESHGHRDVDRKIVGTSKEIFERGDFYFSDAERDLIDRVSKKFKRTVVVLNASGVMETASLQENDRINAVLLAWQGGMEGAVAAAELLLGLESPSGKLADTFARDINDYPSTETFFESDTYVKYYEDIFVGYRYFETFEGKDERVVYPFGYGLSYTTFEITDVHAGINEDHISVSCMVRNTGSVKGREVAQLYFSAPQGKLGKPERQLIRFKKTRELEPGEAQEITFTFRKEEMASFDDTGKICEAAYVLEKGAYRFFVGDSVRDTAEVDWTLDLEEDIVVEKLTHRLVPQKLEKRLLADGSYEELHQSDREEKTVEGYWAAPVQSYHIPEERLYTDEEREKAKDLPKLIDVYHEKITLEEFVKALPDRDIMKLLGGQPNRGLANTYGYGNNELYGIPNVMTADGPAGVRFRPECEVYTTAFPCATLLACTWNEELAELMGRTGGKEARENNIFAWLTPGVNIHRNPLCGRNFEYYSEDPLLAGKMGAALVRGIQSNGVAATPKHFALNNKETNRRHLDSMASERAIREIYLKQFEIIVRESHPWSIMSSYNVINGQRASESHDLLTDILRDEWGFDGMVTTDWWTIGEHYKEVMAGNDMKMAYGFYDRLVMAKEEGLLTREAMEKAAVNILRLILRVD